MKCDFYIDGSSIVVEALVKRVDANTDDTETLSLLLDTGASTTVIDSTVAERLGFDLETLQTGNRLMTANGRINSKILEIPKFSLFGKDLVNFEVSAFELPFQITYFADGLLGMDFLMQFKKITFDFEEKTIETSSGSEH